MITYLTLVFAKLDQIDNEKSSSSLHKRDILQTHFRQE
jgi:hypothetical protein